jgi:short chain dehydrogenase
MELRGAVALVTGGNGGLGQRICHALAKEGVHVAVMYAQSRDQAEGVARELTSRYQVNAAAFACDVTDGAAVERLVGEVTGRFGRLDIVVNDAAYNKAIPFTDLDNLTIEVWDKIIAVNLTGPMRLIRAVAPVMKAQGRGRIVNISSVAGVGPTGSSIAYAVSKSGSDPPDALHGGGVGPRDIGQLRGAGPVGGHARHRQSAARVYCELRGYVAIKKACRQGRLRRHGGHDVPHRNDDRPDDGHRLRPLLSLMPPPVNEVFNACSDPAVHARDRDRQSPNGRGRLEQP